jgi:hypothetical protein
MPPPSNRVALPAATPRDEGENGFSLRLPGIEAPLVFVFFSNNLGCIGSILVSVVGTLLLLILLGVFN